MLPRVTNRGDTSPVIVDSTLSIKLTVSVGSLSRSRTITNLSVVITNIFFSHNNVFSSTYPSLVVLLNLNRLLK